jgi:hypothetical protein
LAQNQIPLKLVLSNFSNFRTLVILLQVDLAFSDEPKIIYEDFYKTENISIFAWFLIIGIGHYHWLHSSNCWLLPNKKANYLIHIIQHILDFLEFWSTTMA